MPCAAPACPRGSHWHKHVSQMADPNALTGAPSRTYRDETRALMRLAGPLIVANLVQMAIYTTDVIFIARLGSEALAASTVAVNLLVVVMHAISGLGMAASPLIAAELGRNRHSVREVRRTVRMALWVVSILTLVGWAILWNGEAVLLLFGQEPTIARMGGEYLFWVQWGLLPAMIFGILRHFVAAMDKAHYALWVTLVMLVANAAGNYVLIFGHYGFPALGLKGAALASVGSNIIGVLALILLIQSSRIMRRFHLFGRLARIDWARVRDIFRIGLPISATMVFEVAIFSAAAFLMGLIGVEELAAHAIALQAAALAFMVPMGIGQAATIRVGMAFGAGDTHWVQRAGRVAMAIGVGFMAFTALLFWLAPYGVIMVWLDPANPANTAVIPLAVSFLSMAALFQLFDGAQVVGAGLLRGLQDTRVPMIYAGIGYWIIGLGGAVAFGFYTPMAGQGIWLGLVIGLASVALLMGVRWKMRGSLGLVPAKAP